MHPANPVLITAGLFSHTIKEQVNMPTDQLDNLDTCLYLAKVLYQGRRFKEALTIIDQAVARHPANVDLLHLRGLCLQCNNNAPAAFATFMSILNLDPNHLSSLCCIGSMYRSRGLLQEAVVAYQRALEVSPGNQEVTAALAALYTDLGSKSKTAGNVQEAIALYQRAVEICPTHAAAYYHLGVVCSEAKQLDAALTWYMHAIRCCPTYTEALCNIGVIQKERGDIEAAVASYEKALEVSPNFTVVKNNLAIALTDLGTRAKLAGRLAEGIALYERALACNPKYADALYNLGVAHGEAGSYDKAIFMYETAVLYNSSCAEAYNNLGVIYKERDNLEKAMECYMAALTVKPNFPQSLNNMGVIFTCQGRAQEALTLLTAAISACPTYAEAYNNLGVLQRDVGAIPQAIASYSRCLELAPDSRNAGQNRLLALNYIYDGNEEQVCKAHAEWGKRFASLFKPLPPLGKADRDWSIGRPLRIGYISPDLFTHSVSYFAEAPLTHHNTPGKWASHSPRTITPTQGSPNHVRDQSCSPNPEGSANNEPTSTSKSTETGAQDNNTAQQSNEQQLELDTGRSINLTDASFERNNSSCLQPQHLVQHVVYCCAPKRDAKTARLRNGVIAAHGIWREVTHLSEPELAKLVREDEIDILVELTGHTANNRLGTVAMRPAPIQVTWIGYPNSTGLTEVDYRITDELCDPLDTSQTYVEELIRLPGSTFLCYTPAVDAPAVAPTPALAAGFVTFGSFNNLAKVTPAVLALWARILRAVPSSRLVLKNKPFACDTARMHLLNQLAAEGVESWRVDLLPLAAANSDHMATYSLMDISLDTFPYAGTTTTCESMYMGVPCLTLAGKGHAHNVGVSLVTSVGLDKDWVAYSHDQYVELAVRHASDINQLNNLRQSLRQRMLSSRLCDAPNFVKRLEKTYHDMWARHVQRMLSDAPEQQSDRGTHGSHASHSQQHGTGIEFRRADTTENGQTATVAQSEIEAANNKPQHSRLSYEGTRGSKLENGKETGRRELLPQENDRPAKSSKSSPESDKVASSSVLPQGNAGQKPAGDNSMKTAPMQLSASRPESPGTPGLLENTGNNSSSPESSSP